MYSKLIEFNGGTETQTALTEGLNKLKLETYRSMYCLMHIDRNLKITVWHKNKEIGFEDAIIHNRYPSDHQFMGIIYEHAVALNIPVINPINTKYKLASEKIGQMARFARCGIAIPETAILRKEAISYNESTIENLFNFPLICKTDGMKGDNVYKIDSFVKLLELVETLPEQEVCLIQEYISNTYDLRLICTFDEYLGAIKRTAKLGNFKNNYSQGGTVGAYEATDEEITLALSVLKCNQIDIGGVDIIHSDRGPLVIEVNQGPAVDGFQSIHTDKKVLTRFAELLEEKYT